MWSIIENQIIVIHISLQSMHEKTAVPSLIDEIYTFLKQADARELTHLFKDLDKAKSEGNQAKITEVTKKIDNFETHVVPMICDIGKAIFYERFHH